VPVPLDVPDLVRQRAESHGRAGRAWLDALPDVVAVLAERWGLAVGSAYAGGTAAYVVAATRADGRECVLKVPILIDDDDRVAFDRSVLVHGLAEGRGCAELLAHDEDPHAMLIEQLGPNVHDLGYTTDAVLEAIADTLQDLWRPLRPDVGLPTGAEKAEWLAAYITTTWDALDRPVERRVVDRAVEMCERRAAAFDPDRSVLVHGDAHGWNTLAAVAGAGEGRCKFVDPEGVVSSPEHDLAAPMREYNVELLAGDTAQLVRERAALLAARCGVDADAVWEWGHVERVSTGLACLTYFTDDNGHAFLEVARRCT
jgi:streptomycin 6-kinase